MLQKIFMKMSEMVLAYNASTWEGEVGGWQGSWIPRQSRLHSKTLSQKMTKKFMR
jgi:hypothetical protein